MKLGTVLILGAKSDIAQAIAYQYAPHCSKLLLAARNKAELEPLASDIQIKHSVAVETLEFDAVAFETHDDFVQALPADVDTAICVFGYLGQNEDCEENFDEALRTIQVNYTGAVSVLSRIGELYKANKKGTIIGISSVAGERGRQSNYYYGSAKAGFSAWLDGLRNRLYDHGVHVVTVKPGFVDTQMTAAMDTPAPLTAQPQQVAKAVFKAHQKKQNTVYTLWMWRWIMLIVKSIPEPIFKKMKM